jgi:hypothetical protein
MRLAQETTKPGRVMARPSQRTPVADIASLRRRLARRNPFLAPVSDKLRDTAGRYVNLADAGSKDAVDWAAYMYRAAYSLSTCTRAQVRSAGEVLVGLARRWGTPAMDVVLPSKIDRDVQAGTVLAVRFAVADLLHAYGLCRAAERECLAALYRWAPHHDEAPNTIQTYLAESMAMLDQCGRTTQRRAMLNAYAGLLPEPGTDEYVRVLAGIDRACRVRRETRRHEGACTARHLTALPAVPGYGGERDRRTRQNQAQARTLTSPLLQHHGPQPRGGGRKPEGDVTHDNGQEPPRSRR